MEPIAPSSPDISIEFPNLFRIYQDGRVERLTGTETVPPSTDPETGVRSKDIVLSPESGLSARIFLPKLLDLTRKLPLLVFIHGGAFVIESPYSPLYHNHAALLASEANVVVLSVNYRRAPEHPLPVAFEDSWEALQWAAAHSNRNGPEAWLNDYVDFDRVFVGGDSAGATLTNHVVHRARVHGLGGAKIVGMVLFHPYFGNEEPDKLLDVIFPTSGGLDDPRVNPRKDPKLGEIGCGRVLVFVAGKDFLSDRAWAYYEALKESGWGGEAEIVESEGEDHVFHLFNPSCDKAVDLVKKVVLMLKNGSALQTSTSDVFVFGETVGPAKD